MNNVGSNNFGPSCNRYMSVVQHVSITLGKDLCIPSPNGGFCIENMRLINNYSIRKGAGSRDLFVHLFVEVVTG